MAAQSAEEFWNQIPQVTKYIVILILALTVTAQFGIVNPYTYVLIFDRIFSTKLELWRLITNLFFFGGFSLPFLINFIIFLDYSSKLEKETLQGRTADFIFMLILGAVPMTAAAYLLGLPVLSTSLMSFLIYVWCNTNTNAQLRLFFIPFNIPARYFPWALMLFHGLMGGSFIPDIVGIVAGHIYYFTVFYYPREYGKVLIRTPSLLQNWFPPQQMSTSGYALNMNNTRASAQAQQPQQQQPMGHRWGTGRRLGI